MACSARCGQSPSRGFAPYTEASQLSDPNPGRVPQAIPEDQPYNSGAPALQLFHFERGQNTGFATFVGADTGREARIPITPFMGILGNAPIISDLVKGKIKDLQAQELFAYGETVSQVGMWLALPPRTPENIVASYGRAFDATLKDPKYQDEFTIIDPDSPVARKADLEDLMGKLAKVSPETLEYLQAELNRQGIGSAN